MQKLFPAFLLAWLSAAPQLLWAQPKIQLLPFATGFTKPTDIAHCGDNRLFIAEQNGYIWILDSLGNRLPDTFLNIDARVRSTGNEQGLLGLAFPPDYAQSGYFYVYYTRETDGDTRVSRFSRVPGNPDKADPNSEVILLTQDQPYSNHNGGCLKFGPDGYLYIGLGDGGNAGDPQGNGQKKNTLLGKILRIDVHPDSSGALYRIPSGNPFASDTAYRPEIWSLGWRNPWRFSFDRLTGDLWVADVGQGAREEIDYEPAAIGGRNYGWRCYEGTATYSTAGCLPAASFTTPVFEYTHSSGNCSVTGGFLYRGNQYADLYGVYLFTDYCTGWWWATRPLADGTFTTAKIADLANSEYSTCGEDRAGELYVAALTQGTIFKIKELCSTFQISGTVTDATCAGALNGSIDLNVQGGAAPVNFTWSNGQTDSLLVYLNPGAYSVQAQDGNGCIRRDTFDVGPSTQIPAPAISAASWSAPLPEPGLICPTDSVLLESDAAPAGYGYQWWLDGEAIPGATQQQFAAKQPGLYQAIFDNGACKSPLSQAFQVPEVTVPVPLILATGPAILCPGDSVLLNAPDAPPGFTLQWRLDGTLMPGADKPQLTVTAAGSYTVAFVRPGCDNLWESDPAIIAHDSVPAVGLFFLNDTLFASPGNWTAYQWYRDGTALAGATAPVLVPGQSGFYEVELRSANGCLYRAGLQVTVVATTLPDVVARYTLAPNPTSGVLSFSLELFHSERFTISLQDTGQRQIFSQTHQGQRLEKKIDLSGLPAGTYYLSVDLESGSFVRPVVKN